VSAPEEYGLCLQHTLKHLSLLSNTVLSEDTYVCLATGKLPPGMMKPSPEQNQQLVGHLNFHSRNELTSIPAMV